MLTSFSGNENDDDIEAPMGFENGYLFSGSLGGLVIILGELGSMLMVWGFGEPSLKVKKNKGKAFI